MTRRTNGSRVISHSPVSLERDEVVRNSVAFSDEGESVAGQGSRRNSPQCWPSQAPAFGRTLQYARAG
jgi:hypothetical protein